MPDLPEELQQQVIVITDNAANIKGAVQQPSMHDIRCLLVNWTATQPEYTASLDIFTTICDVTDM